MARHYYYSTNESAPSGYSLVRIVSYMPQGGLGTMPFSCYFNGTNFFYQTNGSPPSGYTPFTPNDTWVLTKTTVQPVIRGSIPLYRYHNPDIDDYYFTTIKKEYDGYSLQMTDGLVYESPSDDRRPLYRFYNEETEHHYYDINPAAPDGYRLEGIEGYVPTIGGMGVIPLCHFFSEATGNHYYGTESKPPGGYEFQEAMAFVSNKPQPGLVPLYRFFNGRNNYYSLNPQALNGYTRQATTLFVYPTAGTDRVPWFEFYQNPEQQEESGGWLSSIGRFFSNVVTTVVDATTTMVNFVLDTLSPITEAILGFVGLWVSFILSIPYFGRAVNYVLTLVQTFTNGLLSLPDMAGTAIGIMPEKRLRLCVIIQKDSGGVPVASEADVLKSIDYAISVFKSQANVRIIPVRLFNYSNPFSPLKSANSDFIYTERSGHEGNLTLEVSCDNDAAKEDLSEAGALFSEKMHDIFWANGRRTIGYGSAITAFSVKNFLDGKIGCSMGPLTDYITVKFGADRTFSTLAHEIGHACSLKHSDDLQNLMSEKPSFGYSKQRSKLTAGQKILLRASRHVTYY